MMAPAKVPCRDRAPTGWWRRHAEFASFRQTSAGGVLAVTHLRFAVLGCDDTRRLMLSSAVGEAGPNCWPKRRTRPPASRKRTLERCASCCGADSGGQKVWGFGAGLIVPLLPCFRLD